MVFLTTFIVKHNPKLFLQHNGMVHGDPVSQGHLDDASLPSPDIAHPVTSSRGDGSVSVIAELKWSTISAASTIAL
jgi:hypothetical protein